MWRRTRAGVARRPVILVVEDDPDIREMIAQMLQMRDFDVFTAGTAVDALMVFRSRPGAIDVLLTDVQLPGVSGRELARAVESSRSRIPVVYISGVPQSSLISRGLLRPADLFLAKPYNSDTLISVLQSALHQYAATPSR
ncbi:response regulator [Actinoplanes sichuanensis]|uniref:Response regulator n=1 Tax=Actinoplanes sichuanensis TaxID=512349 RepID=A0ABW4A1A1_9ACTN